MALAGFGDKVRKLFGARVGASAGDGGFDGDVDAELERLVRAGRVAEAAEAAYRLGRLRQASELFASAGERARAEAVAREAAQLLAMPLPDEAAQVETADAAAPPGEAPPGPREPQAAALRARQEVARFEQVRADDGDDDTALQEAARSAAEACLAAGDPHKALDVFREARLLDEAINLQANVLGDVTSAAALLAIRGDHDRAAELFEAAGEPERALAAWIRWAGKAGNPLAHFERVERLSPNAGHRFLAAVVEQRFIDRESVELLRRIADLHERGGRPADALEVWRIIARVAPDDRDAGRRIEELERTSRAGRKRRPAAAANRPDRAGPAGGAKAGRPSKPPIALDDDFWDQQERRRERRSMDAIPAEAPPEPDGFIDDLRPTAIEDLAGEVVSAAARDAALIARPSNMPPGSLAPSTPAPPKRVSERRTKHEKAAPRKPAPAGARDDAAHRPGEPGNWQEALALAMHGSAGTGATFGRYALLGELGRGGMAVVYRARDLALEREVALKFMSDEVSGHPVVLEMFKREARSAAQLNHPNIVTVYDVGTIDGRAFICMELVEGRTVEQLLEAQGKLTVYDALRVAENILSALDFAHQRNIVHRDIKPSNMMWTVLGVVKLMDFGLAKSLSPGNKTTMIAGTPQYMAPEQFTGRDIDSATDVFAFGATLYEMLTGQQPFEGMRRDVVPPQPHELNPSVPEPLGRLVMRSIEIDKATRFRDAGEMLRPARKILAAVRAHVVRPSIAP